MTESEEVFAFYHQLGVALAEWAAIEFSLEHLSGRCADGQLPSLGLAVGFRAIENFRSKVSYVDALIHHRYGRSRTRIAEWSGLHKRVLSASVQRNELVHRQPIRIGGAMPGKRIALVESGWSQRAMDGSSQDAANAITIKEVAHRASLFHCLFVELQNFDMKLCAVSGQPEAFPVPQARRPTMRDIEAQMRAALGRQQRPSRKSPP